MTKVAPQTKIQKLKAAQAKLNAELQAAEEQEAEEERKREMQRNMLIGRGFPDRGQERPEG